MSCLKSAKLLGLLTLVLVFNISYAEACQDNDFKPGDKVEVREFDEWIPGVIVRKRQFGLWDVKYYDADFEAYETSFFRTEDIRLSKKTADKRKKRPSKSGADNQTDMAANMMAMMQAIGTPRTWTSSNGKFKIEATFASDDGKTVTLARTNGETIDVPRNKLSKKDIEFLDSVKQMSENMGDPDAMKMIGGRNGKDNNAGENKGGSRSRNKRASRKFTGVTISEPNESRAKPFDFSTTEPFSISVRARASQPLKTSFVLGDVTNDELSVEASLVNSSGSHLVFSVGDKWDENVTGFVGVVELGRGFATPLMQLPVPETVVQDVSPSGEVVLTKTTSNKGGKRLDAFRVANGKLEQIVSWNSGSNKEWSGHYKYARLLDDNRVITLNDDLFEVIQLDPFETLFKFEANRSTEFAIAPDSSSILVYTQGKLFPVDPDTGIASGAVATGIAPSTIAISPSGKIALSSAGNVKVIDSKGATLSEFSTPFSTGCTSAYWLSDRLIGYNESLGRVYVIDTKVGAWLCEYKTGSTDHVDQSGHLWRATISEERVIVNGLRISKPAVLSKLDQLPARMIAFMPGDGVTLDIRLPFDRKTNDEIRQKLTTQLQAIGLKIQPKAKLRLSAFVKKQRTYQESLGFNKVQVTVKPSDTMLQLTKNGTPVWQRMAQNRLNILYGGTLPSQAEMQKEVDNETAPNPNFYKSVQLPKRVIVHRGDKPLVSISVTSGPKPKIRENENW